jgi:glycosyltransferase involved in cell wall biosynthesis
MTDSISVVMATYNGASYIKEQLYSILCQLRVNDEVIIVDDHSSDSTLDLIEKIGDLRIQVHRNDANIGVRRSFEKAIRLAAGDIIFLSDQDDIWHPEKIARFTEIFGRFAEVTLVLSDAKIIDKAGMVIVGSFFARRGGFVPGVIANLIKNRYLGCVMAFRRVLVDRILPFPSSIPQHDMWIGLVNGIYGKAHYIDLPLVEYRRHDNNASSASSNLRGSLAQMIRWRWALIRNLVMRIIR